MIFIKNIPPLLLFILIISFGQSCSSTTFGQHADSLFLVDDHVEITYNLKRPNQKYYMPYVLEEISGLTYKVPHSLLAVDDESGRVFEYNLSEKNITHAITFFKADDYEGVELVNDGVYVLKHDGDLFHFNYSSDKQVIAEKFENDLGTDNDTEGLGYDPELNVLIIACKEDGEIKDQKINGRAFYTYNLEQKKLSKSPAFVIGPKELEAFWESNRAFDYEQDRIKFKPSAIATHPLSGNYYILSSVGKMLLVANKSGKILATYPISPRVLGQPEGICFSPAGELYISSEGEGDRGYVLKFNMKRKK